MRAADGRRQPSAPVTQEGPRTRTTLVSIGMVLMMLPAAIAAAAPPSKSGVVVRSPSTAVADTAGRDVDDVFIWLGEACGATLDNDPDTVPPQPIARGEGRVSWHLRVDADGVAHVRNWVNGTVVVAATGEIRLALAGVHALEAARHARSSTMRGQRHRRTNAARAAADPGVLTDEITDREQQLLPAVGLDEPARDRRPSGDLGQHRQVPRPVDLRQARRNLLGRGGGGRTPPRGPLTQAECCEVRAWTKNLF